ncbi:right-handed parallel beta-helix repeat-containing protein [Halobacteria archaeon AArc-m2/3/4]|uniref:Right-handed parallel beta-helix repeat-containing protein n=1 Tax=Natronoglomus mannanivorans TaxID=2979990 RepID=A0ABT2QF77_9EURY|nr:right-handed parallel beta-helix repeat-containing protein [Halobacteria archaeon AArc-m2/3/4]
MGTQDPPTTGPQTATEEGLKLTRRTALALLGVGSIGAAMTGSSAADHGDGSDEVRPWNQNVNANDHDLFDLHSIDVEHVFTAARDADVIVWKDEAGTFHADSRDGHVESGEGVMEVTQAAVDSLTEGRTTKEKVLVVSSGTVSNEPDERKTIELPSHTVLDVPATIDVEYEPGEHSNDVVVRAQNVENIEIPRLNVRGGPWMAIRVLSCSNVKLGHIDVRFAADSNANDAIRIDDRAAAGRTTDVQLNSAYIENGTQHSVETYGVDRVQIGQVLVDGVEGCAVILNDTRDATVNSVIGHNPESTTRYATFRCANGCRNVSVGQVVSRDAPRGIHITTDSNDVTIGEVNIVGARNRGIAVDGVENVTIQGGLVKNVDEEGFISYGDCISVSNLRIVDDRPANERTQTHAIQFTGTNGRIVNNDVRDGGTEDLIHVDSPTTVVSGNVGDGVASGTTTLESSADPAARIEGVADHHAATLELRASAATDSAAAFAWDHYFEYTGQEWELVIEWRTDPGEDLELDYIVDQPQANIS